MNQKTGSEKIYALVQFDISNFYPSITGEFVMNSIKLVRNDCNFSKKKEIQLIKKAQKSMLYPNGCIWTKKSNQEFNIAMGAYNFVDA